MHNGRSGMVFYALCKHSTANNGNNVLIPRPAHTYYNEKPKWFICVYIFNAPPTLNFALHTDAVVTMPWSYCAAKFINCSLDTFSAHDMIFLIVTAETFKAKTTKKVLIWERETKEGDDRKGSRVGNIHRWTEVLAFDVGERRRDAVCAALSLACLKLL